MAVLKKVVRQGGAPYGYRFWCPGCENDHVLPTKPHEANGWDFNGDEASPTFQPSILVHEVIAGPHATACVPGTVLQPRCHSFVRDGRIQFLGDSTHALAGKTVPLPEIKATPPPNEEQGA